MCNWFYSVRAGHEALLGGNINFSTAGGSGLLPILRVAPVKYVLTTFNRPMFWLYADHV